MRIEVNGVRLFFDIEGAKLAPDGPVMRERPTLILLHGGPGSDHSGFKPLFSQLAGVAQIVYLDQRGNGRSDRGPRDRLTLAQWGDDVRAFCNALEIERPVVMGNSWGGIVAMSYATRHPEHPGKLILSSTSARVVLDRIYAVYERRGGAEARRAAEAFWSNPTPDTIAGYFRVCGPLMRHSPRDPEAGARGMDDHAMLLEFWRKDGEGFTFNFLPALARIACPTLILGGEDDPETTIADHEDIAAAIPSHLVRFERFLHAGHSVYRDAPHAIDVIREFITI